MWKKRKNQENEMRPHLEQEIAGGQVSESEWDVRGLILPTTLSDQSLFLSVICST